MIDRRQTLPVAGPLATIVAAAYMVVQLHAQASEPIDLRNVATAELRDAQGQVVLSGPFMLDDEDDTDDVERKAALQPAGSDPDAAGVAEVEFARERPVEQEVEFSGRNLQPGASYTLVLDGRDVITGVAERDGDLDLDRDVPIPGAIAAR
jgi:hypothetical protein